MVKSRNVRQAGRWTPSLMRARAQRRGSKSTPSTPEPESRLGTLGRGRAAFAIASLVLVIPCLWHARLQAGDLSSHVYNAWLAQLIHQGRAPGLSIVPQYTNVLFDVILSGLFAIIGAEAAQRIAVMAAVLIFAWGAFAFVSTVAGRRAWHLLPILSVLAYGWVFRMGLFNFYLSLGLSFWALAVAWEPTGPRPWAAAALLALACTAHGMPPVWAVALLVWRWLAQRVTPRQLQYLAGGALLAIVALRVAMAATIRTSWSFSQIYLITGVDQAYVYDAKYKLICAGLLVILAAMLWTSRKLLAGIPFQFCALTAAGISILPTWVWLPRYDHALVFIAERMSLALGVCLCAAVAAPRVSAWQRYTAIGVAIVFFLFLYSDERTLNGLEDRIADAAYQLPPGQRVVTAIQAPQLRTNPIDHMIDRICIGRCYSYANYEPSSGAFRIRVTGPTSIVAPTDMDSSRMQVGGYAVKQRDLPLYRISLDDTGAIALQSMLSGYLIGMTEWNGM
jgi:hypothetical protein